MPYSRLEVAKRLRLLPAVFDKRVGEIAELIGVSPSAWSNYTNFNEEMATIPRHAVFELKRVFGITSDWLYFGDLGSIPDDKLRQRIRRAEQGGGKPTGRTPRVAGVIIFLCVAIYPTHFVVPTTAQTKCPAYGLYKPNATLCRTAGIVTPYDAAKATVALNREQ